MGVSQGRRPKPAAVDLFCGAGGLTHGLVRAGLCVTAGIDLDPACEHPYTANNDSRFVLGDVGELTSSALRSLFPRGATRVLVGCAPCQQFSRYSRRMGRRSARRWALLGHFSRLIDAARPAVVSMENVPELASDEAFGGFVCRLESAGYRVSFSSVYCPDYGIPQHRTRLVLFASLRGELSLVPPTHARDGYLGVADAIGCLPPLVAGGANATDPLHRACRLSELNLKRIQVSRPGGCWRDWPAELVANCHRADSGKTYPSVYGRMEWGKPSPTITTQFFGYGSGRFGHPDQDRAISLREGAILQTFPPDYRFCPDPQRTPIAVMGRLIGNAVPVRLGEVIGASILNHLVGEHD